MQNKKIATISAIVITKNEEKTLNVCLKSLKWADEIVVIDNGSSDKTVKVARKNGASVYVDLKESFARRREKGARMASGKWLLFVDADETVTLRLKKEILSAVNGGGLTSDSAAFAIPRRNYIFGKEFKYGGQWPDYVLRLMKKSALVRFEGDLHEQPIIKGNVGKLKEPFIHAKHDNLGDMVTKTNRWSEIEARLMYDANHPPMNVIRFSSAIFREFWLRVIRQMAFLDGAKGVIYAIYQIFSKFISYAKLWEMQLKKQV